jgi:uncharacterized protein
MLRYVGLSAVVVLLGSCSDPLNPTDADAQYDLGVRYYIGEGVPQGYEQAVKWYMKAAAQGHAEAQNDLGFSYEQGEGVPQDYEQAVKWYTKAAEQGNAYAEARLGYCYHYGEGVPQDYEQAVKWYTRAAEQGHGLAQAVLGDIYEQGEGVPQDYVLAYKWKNLVETNYQLSLPKLAEKMTKEQIAEGQRLSTQFLSDREKAAKNSE